jgi:hypothetical protein
MTTVVTPQLIAAQLELAELLRAGRDTMLEPQELPGRYGRVESIRQRLQGVHARYVERFNELVARAVDQADR